MKYIYPSFKIQTKTFTDTNDQIAVEKQWNKLDSELYELDKKRRALQTEYHVDFVNDQNLLVTGVLVLDRKVDIDTHINGWNQYESNTEARKLLIDVHGKLSKQVRRPGICHIKSN